MFFFIFVFGFFFQSLYIGVVVNTFDEVRDDYGDIHLLGENQKKWLTMNKTMITTNALIKKCQSSSKITNICFMIKVSKGFKIIKFLALLFYTSLLIFRDPDSSVKDSDFNYNLRLMCLVFFIIELIISMKALKSNYLRDAWNRLDFIMLFLTLLGYIFIETQRAFFMATGRVLIVTLCVRLIRVTKGSKMMRILIDSFVIALPSILNVGCLLLLIMYIYVLLGI